MLYYFGIIDEELNQSESDKEHKTDEVSFCHFQISLTRPTIPDKPHISTMAFFWYRPCEHRRFTIRLKIYEPVFINVCFVFVNLAAAAGTRDFCFC